MIPVGFMRFAVPFVGGDDLGAPRMPDSNHTEWSANSHMFIICRRAVPWGRHHHFGRFGGGKPPPYGSLFVRSIIGGRPMVVPTTMLFSAPLSFICAEPVADALVLFVLALLGADPVGVGVEIGEKHV